uniref:V-type proton ATPase subunit n=1 Tax=Tetranychus urticae TaxID=32264 RepID=T1KGP2_TETUR
MGASFFCIVFFTAIWIGVGWFAPRFIPPTVDKPIIHMLLLMTAVCCYSMWLFTYMAQMNPLIGPQLSTVTQHIMQREWS